MFASKDTLLTRPSGYTIARSVRLRSSASAYFNRTPASATNQQKFTWSSWFKRGSLGAVQFLMSAGTGGNDRFILSLRAGDDMQITNLIGGVQALNIVTSQLFRDPSAWYHLVVAVDTTDATAANRCKVYLNGSQVTAFSTANYPAQNYNTYVNSANTHQIGKNISASDSYFDGYLTEINFIDGQALTPSSFGETDSSTGVWKAKKYGGTYGTNGFYLNFSDNSNNTAATIGKDYSGNGNNWTPNNISVTSGVTYDSMTDVPTLTSATAANYPVWNPLWKLGGSGYITPTNANLRASIGGTGNIIASTIQIPSSGKWYMELTLTTGVYAEYGLCNSTASGNGASGGIFGSYYNGVNQYAYYNGTAVISDGNQAWVTGDIGLIAVDVSNNKLWIGRNRSGTVVWMGGGNPSSGTSPSFSASGGGGVYATTFDAQTFNNPFVASGGGSDVWDANFGQQPWIGTPPTGFVALNTYNLPAPTIKNGAAYMAATTYTGNGSTQSISNAVNGVSFQPDLVWIKGRSYASSNWLTDSIRGVNNILSSNQTAAEVTVSSTMTAFNSNGFSVGSNADFNSNTNTLVGWQWKAGTTSASNTNGSITSTVSVGATQGFSVVTYTGTGANATVGHGLGVAPSMVIVKNRSVGSGWRVYHVSLTSAAYVVYLNATLGQTLEAIAFNSTAPTSSVFSVGASGDTNGSGNLEVAYCFAAVAGYSAFGSYAVNNSADGPFVYLGFRARWILFKNNGASTWNWMIVDTARDTINTVNSRLFPDLSNAESSTASPYLDITANGFKIRTTGGLFNTEGPVIYAAFAENPFKHSLAR